MAQDQVGKHNQNGISPNHRPDPEVPPKAKRRNFTAKYKLWVLEELDF